MDSSQSDEEAVTRFISLVRKNLLGFFFFFLLFNMKADFFCALIIQFWNNSWTISGSSILSEGWSRCQLTTAHSILILEPGTPPLQRPPHWARLFSEQLLPNTCLPCRESDNYISLNSHTGLEETQHFYSIFCLECIILLWDREILAHLSKLLIRFQNCVVENQHLEILKKL